MRWLVRRLTKWILRRRPEDGAAALELSAALLLWVYLFQLIVVLVVGRSVGSALFLHRFDGRGLALLYILVGLAVAGMVSGLEGVGRKWGANTASLATLAAFGMCLLIAGALMPSLNGRRHLVLFGAFSLLIESFAFVTTIQFWAQANSVLSLEQAGRLYIFIGTGGIVGSLAGGWLTVQLAQQPAWIAVRLICLLIPLQMLTIVAFARLRPRLSHWRPKDFHQWNLDHAAAKVGLAQRSSALLSSNQDQSQEPPSALLRAFGWVSLLMVFSTTLVDYYYKMLADRRYEGDSADLTSFFGGFYCCVGAATLLVQTLVTPQVLRRGSAYMGLTASPAMLGAFAAWNMFQPGLWTAAGFKLVDSVLSHSIYRSCQEVLFTPLPTGWVRRLKLSADGVFGRSGLLLAGCCLFLAAPWLDRHGPQYLLPGVLAAMFVWSLTVLRLRVVFRRCATIPTKSSNDRSSRRLAG